MSSTQNKESDLVDNYDVVEGIRSYLRAGNIQSSAPEVFSPYLKFHISYMGVEISVIEPSKGFFNFKSDGFEFNRSIDRTTLLESAANLIATIKSSVYLLKGTEGWSSGSIWYTYEEAPCIKSKNKHTNYKLLRDGYDTHLMILTNSNYEDCPLSRVNVVYAIDYNNAIKDIKKIINHINKKDVKKPAQNFIY